MVNDRTANVLKWFAVIAMPFFLGLGVVMLVVANGARYVRYEYGKANFPPDLERYSEAEQRQLGLRPFTAAEREALALVAVDYLNRREPAEEVNYLLEEQRLPDSDRAFYNEAEIGHMIDVKHLTDAIRRLWWATAIVVVGGLLLLGLRRETRRLAATVLLQGGVATTGVLLLIGLFIVLLWDVFFVQFHELLFPPGTWMFSYSDSLIRLFPEMFWFDIGVLISGGALVAGVLAAVAGWLWRRALPVG
jgi:integral membrane protein (TIGR01906 family)